MYVLRKYEDAVCVDCGFRGGNHDGNFATVDDPKYRQRARCHACSKKRRAKLEARRQLERELWIKERTARRKKKTFQKAPNVARNLAQVNRRLAVNRRLRKALRDER